MTKSTRRKRIMSSRTRVRAQKASRTKSFDSAHCQAPDHGWRHRVTSEIQFLGGLILALLLVSSGGAQITPLATRTQSAANAAQLTAWESPARLRAALGGMPGTLRIGSQGIDFLPNKGANTHWSFNQIESLDLEKNRVVLLSFDNRKWPLPGTRRFDLRVKNEITATVAWSLTEKIARPVRNGIPDHDAPADTVIAVRRSKHYGGSNGLLRIRQQGIDYVTAQPGQSRSWRWLDIQTLSDPDPYHLFVFGYRDTYAFDLKDALPREAFNHASDEIWRQNESETRDGPAIPPIHAPANGRRKDE